MIKRITTALLVSALVLSGVVLEWTAPTTPGVAGFVVSYGQHSRTLLDVGPATKVELPTWPGTTFYAVQAYNVVGVAGDFSPEVSYTLPSRLVFTLPSGRWLIESNEDVINPLGWIPFWESVGPVQVTIPIDTQVPSRFFRAQKL